MGGGRGKAAAIIASGALALIGAGCGVEEHANDPRPIPSARLSVTLGNGAVTVAPSSVGLGPEHSKQIPQNRGRAQPPIRTRGPMVLTFVIANLTNTKTQLEIRGPHDTSSEPIVANGAGTFQAELPNRCLHADRRRSSGGRARPSDRRPLPCLLQERSAAALIGPAGGRGS